VYLYFISIVGKNNLHVGEVCTAFPKIHDSMLLKDPIVFITIIIYVYDYPQK
jgi:hypothetical protein